jgi:glycosyltransferase involved in cell wall biosynthesis
MAREVSLLTAPQPAAKSREAAPTPVRVIYLETNVDGTIGGSYYSLLYLVKGLDRNRYSPLVVFHTEHTLLPRFQEAGIETVVLPPAMPRTFASRFQSSSVVVRDCASFLQKAANVTLFFAWQAIARALWLRSQGAQIVHLNNSIVKNHDWMLAARLSGVACVTHERGINDEYSASARYWARRLKAIVCISDAVRRQLERHDVSGNLITIHNAFDPAEAKVEQPAATLRAKFAIPAEAPVLVMAGNLKPWKGQESVIRAMAKVVHHHPSVRCLLVGAAADPEFAESMRQLVADLRLQQHVVFVGFHPNVIDFMAMADVVIHASVQPEPFGRVALEAMACSKPIVGSAAGGIPEIIDEGRTGLTFPPGNSDALAAQIRWLLDHPVEASRMGACGYERLVKQFPISSNVEATQRLYERILAS